MQYTVQIDRKTQLVFDIEVRRSPFGANYKRYAIMHKGQPIRFQLTYPSEADCKQAYSTWSETHGEVTK